MNYKVSVIMPVKNAEKFVKPAIASILNQTYPNFEFIIICDGSNSQTQAIIQEFARLDGRIKIITHRQNQGIVTSLNEGLRKAKGKYILRMDADDISLPERFATQIAFMDQHKSVVACGSWIEVFGNANYIWRPPTTHKQIKVNLFFNSVIAHPSACIRKSVFDRLKIKYNRNYAHIEDYKLWTDVAKVGKLANIPKVLLKYRSHSKQISAVEAESQRKSLEKIKGYLLKQLIPDVTRAQIVFHAYAMGWPKVSSREELERIKIWLEILLEANSKMKIYDVEIFNFMMAEKWLAACYHAEKLGIKRYLLALGSGLLRKNSLKVFIKMKTHSMKEYLKATKTRFIHA